MSSMESTFRGMFGGPCPACGEHGELLAHDVTYGGYRQIRHMDGSGHEHLCTLPEEQGILYTSSEGWRYEPKGAMS